MLAGGVGNDRYVLDSLADRVIESAAGGTDRIESAVWTDLRVNGALQVEALLYTGAAATLQGNDLANALTSIGAGNDTLEGGAGNDTLSGGGGADVLRGGTGDDVYLLGAGDVVEELAGAGIDSLQGTVTSLAAGALATTVENLFHTGAVGTSLLGNTLDNLVSGGAGNDTVTGDLGADTLVGSAGADSLQGGDGEDLLYGGGLAGRSIASARVADTSIDWLVGGAGNDRYWIEDLRDRVVELAGGGGFDVVVSTSDASLTQHANVEALVLQGLAWLGQGSTRNNILVGHQGDNRLVGDAGDDTLAGQSDVNNTTGTQGDVLEGGAGADVLLALDLSNGAGARETTLLGGEDNDLYVVGWGAGNCSGFDSGGTDTAVLFASTSLEAVDGVENIYLRGASAALDLRAQQALDRAYAALRPGAVFDSVAAAFDATGNAMDNRIVGNLLANAMWGRDGDDTITGAAGNDTLGGEAGTDSLVGGLGNDDYFLDTGDVVVELSGQGFDVLNSASITSLAGFAHVEGLRYLGTVGVHLHNGLANSTNDLFVGGSGQDTLSGIAGADTLAGGAGNDSVVGGAGNDVLAGDAGNDTVQGGTEDDSLAGGAGVDDLQGGAGIDSLDGGSGNDVLQGGSGNDVLVGGAGDDMVYGGESDGGSGTDTAGDVLWGDAVGGGGVRGSDTFVLDQISAANGARETFPGSMEFVFLNGTTIADFQQGVDKIALPAAFVGDGDTVLEGVATQTAPGGTFSATAELILVRADAPGPFVENTGNPFSAISMAGVAAAIGQADAALAVSAMRIIVVDDGTHSAVFAFQSNDGNADVTGDEIFLMGVVSGQAALSARDFLLLA